jgi:phosphomannomutase
VYQHSAVGRDVLVDLLRELGAEVVPVGRSETFVPIDTEAIDDATLENIRNMAQQAAQSCGRVDAIVSTDGDSDRPMLVGIDSDPAGRCVARFFPGDLVGMVVADYLGADAVVVPVSCNDAIDRSSLRERLEPKTRIGSPFVIAGMEAAAARGRRCVCGWEANGGFLVGSDIAREGRVLRALPTRDAFLPILCVLSRMQEAGQGMSAVFDALPHRFSRAALLRNFPRATSLKIVAALTPVGAVSDKPDTVIRDLLQQFFTPVRGFGAVDWVDYTDGVRIGFSNGDVAHIRPSGNADEFRIYAVADTQDRADEIARLGVAEPDGILRRMEQAFA